LLLAAACGPAVERDVALHLAVLRELDVVVVDRDGQVVVRASDRVPDIGARRHAYDWVGWRPDGGAVFLSDETTVWRVGGAASASWTRPVGNSYDGVISYTFAPLASGRLAVFRRTIPFVEGPAVVPDQAEFLVLDIDTGALDVRATANSIQVAGVSNDDRVVIREVTYEIDPQSFEEQVIDATVALYDGPEHRVLATGIDITTPTMDPTGRFFAWSVGEGDQWQTEISTLDGRLIASVGACCLRSWSADGRVVLVGYGGDYGVVDVERGREVAISAPGTASLSPDGQFVAVASTCDDTVGDAPDEVRVFDVWNGPTERFGAGCDRGWRAPHELPWSSDSRAFAIVDGPSAAPETRIVVFGENWVSPPIDGLPLAFRP
jgi:hypothetical protein